MKTERRIGILVGCLFLAAMVASLMGGALVSGVMDVPEPAGAAETTSGMLLLGVFLELVNGLSVAWIAILMFPFIRLRSNAQAAGYLAMRSIESVFCCAIVIAPLTLLALGSLAPDPAVAAPLGQLARAQRAVIVDLLIPVFFGIGALILYTYLFQSRMLPRFISTWGLVGAGLILLLVVLQFLGLKPGLQVNMMMALPIILNEVFMGIWLIVKGFNPAAALWKPGEQVS